MKNNVMQAKLNVYRLGLIKATIYVVLFVSSLLHTSIAQEHFTETPTPANIKYMGLVEEKLLFNVNIENKESERCWISIIDENGEVFFKQEFKDAKYAKTFGISKDEIQGKNLVFVFIKGKTRHEHVFNVTTNSRIVEDVVVAKM